MFIWNSLFLAKGHYKFVAFILRELAFVLAFTNYFLGPCCWSPGFAFTPLAWPSLLPIHRHG
jgi:hypothetical protein